MGAAVFVEVPETGNLGLDLQSEQGKLVHGTRSRGSRAAGSITWESRGAGPLCLRTGGQRERTAQA